MQRGAADALDRRDGLSGGRSRRQQAARHRRAVEQHRAGAAHAGAAHELGAGEAELVRARRRPASRRRRRGRVAELPLIVIVLICELLVLRRRWCGRLFAAALPDFGLGAVRRRRSACAPWRRRSRRKASAGCIEGYADFGAVDRNLDIAARASPRVMPAAARVSCGGSRLDRGGDLRVVTRRVMLVEIARLAADVRRTAPRHAASPRTRPMNVLSRADARAITMSGSPSAACSAAAAAAVSAASARSCTRSITARNSASLDLK